MAEGGVKISLGLNLSQRLVMTPQLQQAIKLLLLSRMELTQVIEQEMMENPLLEEGEPETPSESEVPAEEPQTVGDMEPTETATSSEETFDLKWEDYYLDEETRERGEYPADSPEDAPSYEQTLAHPVSLTDHLLWQLNLSAMTGKEREVGTLLIGNIDDEGYLKVSLEEVSELMGVPLKQVESVLKVVQGFDPPGVAARDLRECLLIQVAALDLAGTLVEEIVKDHLPTLERRDYQKMAVACNASVKDILQGCKIIEHLEPKPGRPFFSQENTVVIPDVMVVKTEAGYQVLLNDDGAPKLKISAHYRSLLRSRDPVPEATRTYLEGKLRSALWLVRSIEQRNETIKRVAKSIVKFQREFLDQGLRALRPLVLRQVAEDIMMHESTVSRVTTQKYMLTPQGIYEMKFFFNNGLGHGEDEISAVVIRELIRKAVASESSSRPLKDQEIVEHLKGHHIDIARRTVTKYRVALRIPSSRRRRKPEVPPENPSLG